MDIHDIKEQVYKEVLHARGVETPCKKCGGLGVRVYRDTSTWRDGIGGQALTDDVCDTCWGSGDANKSWVNLRKLFADLDTAERIAGIRAPNMTGNVAKYLHTGVTWQAGRPTKPGVYLVRHGRRIINCVRCTEGPRGGKQPLREVNKVRRHFVWNEDEYEWLRVGE